VTGQSLRSFSESPRGRRRAGGSRGGRRTGEGAMSLFNAIIGLV